MTEVDPWNAVTTATKIRVARILFRLGTGLRNRQGKSGPMVVTRRGVRFEVDLAEGIDLAIFFLGVFEPATTRALSRLTGLGAIAFDIGANIGFHTLHLARAVGPSGRVFAFEPTEYAHRKLQRNLELNAVLAKRVTVVRAYLDGHAPQDRPTSFYSSWRLDHMPDQHPKHFGSMNSAADATRLCLDDFIASQQLRRVDVVKLDVDGFECRVLAGAPRMLEDRGPTFVAELCPYALEEHGASAAEMLANFSTRGYRFYDERKFHALPPDPAALTRRIPRNSSINIIAAKAR